MTITEKRSTTTVYVEHCSAKLIKCVARAAFTIGTTTNAKGVAVGGVSIAQGETFYLVQSSTDEHRYYVVAFKDYSWTCSCGAGKKAHAHNKTVKNWIVEHVVKPRTAAIQAKKAVPVEPAAVEVTPIQHDDTDEIELMLADLEAEHNKITSSHQPVDNSARGSLNGNAGFNLMKMGPVKKTARQVEAEAWEMELNQDYSASRL